MSIPSNDDLTAALASYAAPLPLGERQVFIDEVVAELANVAEIGPGTIARTVRGIQARYLDQQAVGVGPRRSQMPKYSRPGWSGEHLRGKRRVK